MCCAIRSRRTMQATALGAAAEAGGLEGDHRADPGAGSGSLQQAAPQRIFERRQKKHGFRGGYTVVKTTCASEGRVRGRRSRQLWRSASAAILSQWRRRLSHFWSKWCRRRPNPLALIFDTVLTTLPLE